MINALTLNNKDVLINGLKIRRNKLINRLGKIKFDQKKALTEISENDASEKEHNEFSAGLVEVIRKELKQIDKAVWRIENNVYDICFVCKNNISSDRLNSYPYTDKCTKCSLLRTLQAFN